MADTNYRIKIVRPDFQFEAEGDKSFVLEMLNRFESTDSAKSLKSSQKAGQAMKSAPTVKAPTAKAVSESEFIRQLGFKKHTDIVLAFGYYREKYSGLRDFTPADINSCYYDAKMESSNTSQMIIRNIKQGRMMEAKKAKGEKKTKKSYVLTRSGEDFIDKKLSKLEN